MFSDATPRQQQLLRRSADLLGGFDAETDITSVTYEPGTEVPKSITYVSSTDQGTRNVVSFYGSLGLLPTELDTIQRNRLNENNTVSNSPGISRTPTTVNTIQNNVAQDFDNTAQEVVNTGSDLIKNAAKRRISQSGLDDVLGAVSQVAPSLYANIVGRFPSSGTDSRVKISDPSGRISTLGGALAPLQRTDFKVVFPYTPEISINHQANYQDMNPTHSNYEYLFYQNSVVSEISISAMFTARNADDAEYVLAAQHFFRSATKMFSGNDDIAGLPPIVCRLEGHGSLQFSYVPIVVTGFNVILPSDVDYISAVGTGSNVGRVPTMQTMTITAKPIYSRNRVTNDFSLDNFAKGNLLGSPSTGIGGFI